MEKTNQNLKKGKKGKDINDNVHDDIDYYLSKLTLNDNVNVKVDKVDKIEIQNNNVKKVNDSYYNNNTGTNFNNNKSNNFYNSNYNYNYNFAYYSNQTNYTNNTNPPKPVLEKSKPLQNETNNTNKTNSNNDNTSTRAILCVDALNFSHNFFDLQNHWNLLKTTNKVKKFVSLCRKQGYEPLVFIDGPAVTDEADKKWRTRREDEVLKGEQATRVPQCTNKLIYELFSECGVTVHFSIEADNDDTLAAYAHYHKGYVLSADRDFLRYVGYQYHIYKSFYIEHNKVYFEDQTHVAPRYGVPYRQIFTELPKTGTKWQDYMLIRIDKFNLKHRRGASTYYVNKLGNPHITIKELRRALYNRLGIREKVKEVFPTWDFKNHRVEWYEKETTGDGKYDYLLNDPDEAIRAFFPSLEILPGARSDLWDNHLFAVHVLIYELCSVAMNVSLVSLIRNCEMYKMKSKNNVY